MHSGPANKETRVKAQFGPTESSCTGRKESGTIKGLWDLVPSTAGKQGAAQSGELGPESPASVAGWGLDGQMVDTLD